MQRSDLPFGSEFSPSQIDLKHVLELAQEHGSDWRVFEACVKAAYFSDYNTNDYNRGKLANNTKLGMIAYGIIDRNANLTEFGQKLYAIREDETKLYEELGKYILLNLHGLNLVQCVQDMQVAGETVTLTNLRHWLGERGIHFPRGGKHPSIMRLWLEKAGVFVSGWRVNEAQLQALLGMAEEEIEALMRFSPEQRAYLKTLANIGEPGPFQSNDVERLASATYGVRFNEKSLPKDVLYPLRDAGYITLERGTRQSGRGAKPFLVTPTEKLVADLITPLLEQIEKQSGAEIRQLLRKTLAEILEELKASDTHTKGLALEALAFKLMRLLDMDYVATRLRGTATGGAEVDLIFESSRLVYSRWQIQCKNTSRVSLDDVAKEVGLTHFLKSNVIVMVSAGTIGDEARRYANKVMADSNLCIVMVSRDDIDQIKNNPTAIVSLFNREAKHAMKLKVLEIGG